MTIRRKGTIGISDASIRVNDQTGDFKNGFDAEPILKAQLVLRLVAYLKSQGWSFHVPYDDYAYLEHGSSSRGAKRFAEKHRKGIKDGLEIEVAASGAGLDIDFWENVTDHTADNSNGGRYVFDKESKMPYRQLCRFRATKLKIITFLTTYHDYTVMENARPLFPKRHTGLELVQQDYKTNQHVHGKGVGVWDVDPTRIADYNSKSAEGIKVQHGSMVWARGYDGRWIYGMAIHNINNMWWILCGKWSRYNIASFEIHTQKPCNLHVRVSQHKATRSLENKIKKAVDNKDFLLAHKLQTALDQQFGEVEAA
ncbi:hypothetical protein [Vibrio parahaemolyticus]|uniref:hypothetical protein n=1 Tax=Vibrio parahaemolyticus TaxID=670 RepID=UPI001C9BF35F|nr:hypothetical protein [Vibrio parahaemolyticus]MBY7719679.1 hypothetical protein [Vibrio parahaemolyticus]